MESFGHPNIGTIWQQLATVLQQQVKLAARPTVTAPARKSSNNPQVSQLFRIARFRWWRWRESEF